MKIAFVYPGRDRPETFVKDQITYLQPQILMSNGFYPVDTNSQDALLTFPFNYSVVRGLAKRFLPRWFHSAYSRSVSAFLKKQQVELLFIQYGSTGANLLDAARIAQVPMVVHFHGYEAYEVVTLEFYKEKYRQLFDSQSIIIAVSRDMQQQLIHLGADPEKIVWSPCGVNLESFKQTQPSVNEPILLSVGRMVEKKAPLHTIQAFHDALPELPVGSRLVMIGDGALLASAKQKVSDLNISQSVLFTGALNHNDIAMWMRKSRLYVQHSVKAANGDCEGTPVSILEASASGLPVISTLHGGIKDAVVHNQTGYLVQEHDIASMTSYIVHCMNNREHCDMLGDAGRKHMQANYAVEHQHQRLQHAINMALKSSWD